MKKYNDLELSILSCLVLKPELMKKVKFEDKHIVKYQRLWQFLKSFYEKFGNFDPILMFDICSDNWNLVAFVLRLTDLELNANNFEIYQNRLIESYNELKKEKWIIEKVYKLANNLYVRNININEFRNEVDKIYENAETIFKDEN